MPHLQVRGKGDKIRYLPIEPGALRRIREYSRSPVTASSETRRSFNG